MSELRGDLLLIVGASAYVGLVILIPVVLKDRGAIQKKTARELVK